MHAKKWLFERVLGYLYGWLLVHVEFKIYEISPGLDAVRCCILSFLEGREYRVKLRTGVESTQNIESMPGMKLVPCMKSFYFSTSKLLHRSKSNAPSRIYSIPSGSSGGVPISN